MDAADLYIGGVPFCVNIITARKRSLGQGNIFISVCHSVHRGGVPDQVHPPWDQAGTPPRSRLRHTVNARAVRILLECILVGNICTQQI